MNNKLRLLIKLWKHPLTVICSNLCGSPTCQIESKAFFETHKVSIHLFLVIMNVLSYQGSGCKYMFCCAVIWQKPIWDLWRCTCTYTSSCNLSLHFILFSASLTAWQNFNPVHSAMLFSQRFFCRPLLLPHCTVLCKIVLASPNDLDTCPNHSNLRFFTVVKISL